MLVGWAQLFGIFFPVSVQTVQDGRLSDIISADEKVERLEGGELLRFLSDPAKKLDCYTVQKYGHFNYLEVGVSCSALVAQK